MRDIIFNKLQKIEIALESWKSEYERDSDDDFEYDEIPANAIHVSEFVKEIAACRKDYELMGLCEAVRTMAQEHLDRTSDQYWAFEEARAMEVVSHDWLNATTVGRFLNPSLNAVKTNKLLEALGYQVKSNDGWVLTDKATGYGEQCGLTTGERPYVRWGFAIVEVVNVLLKNDSLNG